MIQINFGDNVNELLETASPHYRALLLTLREKVIDLAFIVQSNEPFGRQASSSRTTVFVLGDDLHSPLGPTADQTRPRPRGGRIRVFRVFRVFDSRVTRAIASHSNDNSLRNDRSKDPKDSKGPTCSATIATSGKREAGCAARALAPASPTRSSP